jgi:hypothetical protein
VANPLTGNYEAVVQIAIRLDQRSARDDARKGRGRRARTLFWAKAAAGIVVVGILVMIMLGK